MTSKIYRRGYHVGVLIGIDEKKAVLWKVYSKVIKPEKTIDIDGDRSDSKALYNFHELIVDALRPTIKEGVRSVILASPTRTTYTQDLIAHIRQHHTWLVSGSNRASFAEVKGLALSHHDVTLLTRQPAFRQIVEETTVEETETLLELLEKRLNSTAREFLVMYSLSEIEDEIFGTWIPGRPVPDYLLLVDTYLSGSRSKNRIQRLIQIAANKGVKTRILKSKTDAGKRLLQFGGIVFILKPA